LRLFRHPSRAFTRHHTTIDISQLQWQHGCQHAPAV
jgi:hypothetical protein